MRAADVAQARLVISEANLREAKSGSDLILRVGFLYSKNCISTKEIFVAGFNNRKAALEYSCSHDQKLTCRAFTDNRMK